MEMGAPDKKVAEEVKQAKEFNLLETSWPYPQPVSLQQRVMLIMRECTYIQKQDKGGLRFDFVSYDALAAKVHPLLVKYGVLVIPTLVEHRIDGNRVEAVIDVIFSNVDKPEDHFISRQISFGVDQQDKGPGKSYTYAVKTAMLRVFCLEAGKGEDPDANQSEEYDHKPGVISQHQLETLAELALEVGAHVPSFCKFLKIADLADLKAADYEKAVRALETKRKAANNNKGKDNGTKDA
jgi:hypothetical protein